MFNMGVVIHDNNLKVFKKQRRFYSVKLVKRISSIFLALTIVLTVVGFASAAPATENEIKQRINGIQIKDSKTNKKVAVKDYPDVVNVITKMLLDLKVEQSDFDNKKPVVGLGAYIENAIMDSCQNEKDVLSGMIYMISMSQYASKNHFPDGCASDEDYSGIIANLEEGNGNKRKRFYWINKDKSKQYIKSLLDGQVAINESDYDSLFLKHTEGIIANYFGGIDNVFSDDELFAKFVQSIMEVMKDGTIGLQLSEKGFTKQASAKRSDAVNDYKKIGQYLVTKILGSKGLEEGKDYEVVYDSTTGHIKELKNLSSKESTASSSVSSEDNSAYAQLMNNVFIVVCILLAVIVAAAVIIVIVVLVKRK